MDDTARAALAAHLADVAPAAVTPRSGPVPATSWTLDRRARAARTLALYERTDPPEHVPGQLDLFG